MRKERSVNTFLKGERIMSIILVWLLILSSIIVIISINQPTSAAPLDHSGNTAQGEDQDRGDGLDYNGDTVGDGKVTWHAVNNTHLITSTFLVEDGYIFEIEEDCNISLGAGANIFIGQSSGATFFCNGTAGNEVKINGTSQGVMWDSIRIMFNSYAYMNSTNVESGFLISVENSILDMSNSKIANMSNLGIYADTSTITLSNSYIANTSTFGIYLTSSDAVIDNNDIYGYNATGSTNGGYGIYITGASTLITISNNTIIGGDGGDNTGGGGGSGGFGIFDINYDGRVWIVDNDLIQGGNGGENAISGESAGDGGYAIHFFPVSNYDSPPAIDISNNNAIIGGRGGDILPTVNGAAGDGGLAIRISDDGVKGGEIVISDNDYISGGEGGDCYAVDLLPDGNPGWWAGNGSDAVRIEFCQVPGSVQISLNPDISGGIGGNAFDMGDPGVLPPAGEGGNGITLYETNNVIMDQLTVSGGKGGDNTPAASSTVGGDGGVGILVYSMGIVSSEAIITSSTITGGTGGDNWVDGGGGGSGGSALFSTGGIGSSDFSDLFGGKGGDNFGPNGGGGGGRYGVGFSSSVNWAINEGNITGGKGGDNYEPTGGGGGGGSAIYISLSDTVELNSIISIEGGNGGDAPTGNGAPGDASQSTIYAQNSNNVDIIGNNIIAGSGGFNPLSGLYGLNGTYCLYGTNLGISNSIEGNDITTDNTTGNTYGIFLNPATATISDNDIYENNIGIAVVNSDPIVIGGNNRIFDNNIGIYLSNSDAIVESSSIINSGSWSVYCIGGSSPELFNSTLKSSPGGRDFYINGDSHPRTLNTTFDKDRTIYGDTLSNLTVDWYLHVKVVDTNFIGVGGATVWINDTTGKNIDIRTTDGQGWTYWVVVTEYVEQDSDGDNFGEKKYYTAHNLTAWESGRFGNNLANMSKSRTIMIMLEGMGFEIFLNKGWNMISIPMNQTDTSLTNVLWGIDGNYEAVQWYNISDSQDSWKHYQIGKGAMNDLSNINRLMGIWIYMKSDDRLNIVGEQPKPSMTDIDLKMGWNFVGYPSMSNRLAPFGLPPEVDMIQHFNANDGSDPWKEYDPGLYSPDDLLEIKPGFGLWIHATGDSTWSVDW